MVFFKSLDFFRWSKNPFYRWGNRQSEKNPARKDKNENSNSRSVQLNTYVLSALWHSFQVLKIMKNISIAIYRYWYIISKSSWNKNRLVQLTIFQTVISVTATIQVSSRGCALMTKNLCGARMGCGKWTAWWSLGWEQTQSAEQQAALLLAEERRRLGLTHAVMAKIARNSWWAVRTILRRQCEMSLLGALSESYSDRTESPGKQQAKWELTLPWPFIHL